MRYSPSPHPLLRLFSHVPALRSGHMSAGAITCPRQLRHASVMNALALGNRILFLKAGAYTLMALGGCRGEKEAESGFSGRIIRLPDIWRLSLCSLPVYDGCWKGERGKFWLPRAGASISQHIHFDGNSLLKRSCI